MLKKNSCMFIFFSIESLAIKQLVTFPFLFLTRKTCSLTAAREKKKRSAEKVTLCTFENFDSRDLLTIPPRRLIFSRTSESEDYITHTVKKKKKKEKEDYRISQSGSKCV